MRKLFLMLFVLFLCISCSSFSNCKYKDNALGAAIKGLEEITPKYFNYLETKNPLKAVEKTLNSLAIGLVSPEREKVENVILYLKAMPLYDDDAYKASYISYTKLIKECKEAKDK